MGFADDFYEKERTSKKTKSNCHEYLSTESRYFESKPTKIDLNRCFEDLKSMRGYGGYSCDNTINNILENPKSVSSNNIINNKNIVQHEPSNNRDARYSNKDQSPIADNKFRNSSENMYSRYERKVSHRILAAELKESNLQVKEENGQYSPQYLITPTGAKANRVFIIGTLTEKEDIGTDSEFWRGRIVDPTGAFFVSAGRYQPDAAQVLAKSTPPEFIAVIGKPTTFTTKEGNVLVSIRAESMHVVDSATRDRWVVETADLTMKRLAKLQENEPDALKAREHYSTNVKQYKAMVAMALESMKAR